MKIAGDPKPVIPVFFVQKSKRLRQLAKAFFRADSGQIADGWRSIVVRFGFRDALRVDAHRYHVNTRCTQTEMPRGEVSVVIRRGDKGIDGSGALADQVHRLVAERLW